jgi:hypothetical protein
MNNTATIFSPKKIANSDIYDIDYGVACSAPGENPSILVKTQVGEYSCVLA